MFLSTDENPNCGVMEPRVFQERSEPRSVAQVLRQRGDKEVWCDIVALKADGNPATAQARKVDDSGEGTCYLVYGDRWGIRLKDPHCQDPWSLEDPHQWGEAFLLLPADGTDLRFLTTTPDESTS
jgi:hypothetical protein